MLSTSAQYALRVVAELARVDTGASVNARVLADRLAIPRGYLAKVLARLTRARLLVASRGFHGGHRLARDPRSVKLAEVVDLIEGVRPPVPCLRQPSEECGIASSCTERGCWREALVALETFLADRTVADLAGLPPEELAPDRLRPARAGRSGSHAR